VRGREGGRERKKERERERERERVVLLRNVDLSGKCEALRNY
jgi:hypothetical protein